MPAFLSSLHATMWRGALCLRVASHRRYVAPQCDLAMGQVLTFPVHISRGCAGSYLQPHWPMMYKGLAPTHRQGQIPTVSHAKRMCARWMAHRP